MKRSWENGFTLIEILMAIVIIGILSAVAMRAIQSSLDSSRVRETQSEMDQLAYAIAGNPNLNNNGKRSDFGYVGDIGAVPSSLDDLVTNPGGLSTWNGPYISGRFTQDADGYKKDAWGNDYTLTDGITLASTGGGVVPMTKSVAASTSDLLGTTIVGTVKDAGGNPPDDSAIAITVSITYPDGSGGTTSAIATPTAGGAFAINGVPIGTRLVTAVYRATNDTAVSYATLFPGSGGIVSLRLPGAPFAANGGGAGGASGQIEFVHNSSASPSNDVRFSIWNTGADAIDISSIVATYPTTAYYRYVRWGGTEVFNSSNPRAGSGDLVNFTTTQTLNPGQIVEILLDDFKANPTGGSNVQLNSVNITIEFNNGQTVAFNSA